MNEEIKTSDAEVTEKEESSHEPDYSESVEQPKKKLMPIIVIVLAAIVIFFVIIASCIPNPAKRDYKYIAEEYQMIFNGEYNDILEEIEEYNEDYPDKKKYIKKLDKIKSEIEEEIYNELQECEDYERENICAKYMRYFPEGKYIDDCVNIRRELAAESLETAKDSIKAGSYYFADSELSAIAKNPYADEKTKNEAKKLAESIESKAAILGTWKKATGVQYTFEEDGHMSVSMPSYDASKGTALDGIEVKSLLGEIDDFGRIVRGGTWQYLGEEDGLHGYALFYNSSYYYVIADKDNGRLGIQLQSGLGEMTFLTR